MFYVFVQALPDVLSRSAVHVLGRLDPAPPWARASPTSAH